MTAMYDAAVKWLDQGVDLVPLQPRKKTILAGYGPYLQHIDGVDAARFWFAQRACNMAVLTGNGLIVLDFDDIASYEAWRLAWPVCAQTYTERTADGVHVFLAGDVPQGRRVVGIAGGIHAEVKYVGGFAMSAPSVHPSGMVYRAIGQPSHIHNAPPDFLLLSEKSNDHDPLSRKESPGDLVSRIKTAWPLLEYAQSITRLRDHGRYWHGHCPIDEHGKTRRAGKLPFWVDTSMGLWGCYACNVRGDVINLYAEYNHISVGEAIRRMVATL